MTIEVLPPGTTVLVGPPHDRTLEGTIIAVCVRYGNVVEYQVETWTGGTCNVTWLNESEIIWTADAGPIKIGYKTCSKS